MHCHKWPPPTATPPSSAGTVLTRITIASRVEGGEGGRQRTYSGESILSQLASINGMSWRRCLHSPLEKRMDLHGSVEAVISPGKSDGREANRLRDASSSSRPHTEILKALRKYRMSWKLAVTAFSLLCYVQPRHLLHCDIRQRAHSTLKPQKSCQYRNDVE
jgi:hypothetical protein